MRRQPVSMERVVIVGARLAALAFCILAWTILVIAIARA